MGHGDHLKNGIMYHLHYEIVSSCLESNNDGLRYLIYYSYARRIDDASRHWKSLALFTPKYLRSIDEHRPDVPATDPVPSVSSGFYAVQRTEFDYWPSSFPKSSDFGLLPSWLTFLHRAVMVEKMRSPGLFAHVLATAPELSQDALIALHTGLFPVEVLREKRRVAVFLQGSDWAIDTLVPIARSGISSADVFHPEEPELRRVQQTYHHTWTYHSGRVGSEEFLRRAGSADLIVLDHFRRGTKQTLGLWRALLSTIRTEYLICIDEVLMNDLGCSVNDKVTLQTKLGILSGQNVSVIETYFRYRYPLLTYWVWVRASDLMPRFSGGG